MKQEIISCDMCGKKRETLGEKWFTVWLETVGAANFYVRFICEPHTSRIEGKDACGEVCAMRFFDRWLQHGNLEGCEPRPVKAQSA